MTSQPRYGAEPVDTAPLLQPLDYFFSSRRALNRFLKAAMTERLATWDAVAISRRGVPTEGLVNVYQRWGEGQFGTILTGNIMVDLENLEAPGNMIIPVNAEDGSARLKAFSRLAQAAKCKGSLIIGQVSHPGRQVEDRLQKNPVSASDVHLGKEIFGMKFAKPHAASKEEIHDIIDAFANAAHFLWKAGFDGVQLHGAHGYLLSQFLAQQTNRRTDEYGGILKNRARIIEDIAIEIRKRIPLSARFILGIKLNSMEFQQGGFSVDECSELCQILEKELQFDFVELSGGTYEDLAFEHKRESTRKREAFFIEFADAIAPKLSQTKVFITGGFKTLSAMSTALDTVDGVGLGRPACAEPDLPAAVGRGDVTTGVIRQALDDYDYGLTETVAGTQIRQMAQGKIQMDMTKPANVEAFKKSMGDWEEALAKDAETMSLYGYIDVQDIQLRPYGPPSPRL